MQLIPLQSFILVSVHEGHETSLHLPQGAKVQPYAKVLAIGPDVKTLAVGDKVVFPPSEAVYADDSSNQVVVRASSVFAKYEDETPGRN